MEYKLGDIFYCDEDYSNKAKFCNENGYMIVEIEADGNGKRQYQIQEVPAPTEEELKQQQIWELKQKLADSDYKAIKYAESQISEEDYAETKAQRQAWRDQINELEA